jgi:hypothetical protein
MYLGVEFRVEWGVAGRGVFQAVVSSLGGLSQPRRSYAKLEPEAVVSDI